MVLSKIRAYHRLLLICFSLLIFNTVRVVADQIMPEDSVYRQIMADSAQAFTYRGLDYYHAGDFEPAEIYLRKSLEIYRNIYPGGHRKIGTAYLNLGSVAIENWQYNKAMDYLDKAEEQLYLDPEKYARDLGSTLTNKGIVYNRLGDFKKAKMLQEMALKVLLGFDDPKTKRFTIHLYNSLAVISKNLKEYEKAIGYYLKAEQLALKYNENFLHIIYGNLGVLYEKTNNFAKSEEYYKKTIREFPGQSISQPFKLAQVYSNYAGLCLKNRIFEKTYQLNKHAEALIIKNLGKKNPIASDIYKLFGQYFEAKANYDSALCYYQKSICSLFDDYNDLSVYSNPDITATISKTHLLDCMKSKAGALKKQFELKRNKRDLMASLESYDLAVKVIDEIRMGYQDEESKLFLNENERATYDEAVSAAYMMYHVTGDALQIQKAFEFSEKSKASVLLSALRDAGAKGFGGIPDSLLLKENDLIRDIAFYSEQLYEEKRKNESDSLKIDLLERKLFHSKESYDDLILTFENHFPDYYALKYRTGMISIEEIQYRLDKAATLIEYTLSDSVLYTFLIRKDHFELSLQPLDSQFNRAYSEMLAVTGQFDPTRHDAEKFNRFVSSSNILFQYLIKPLEEKIKGHKLIVIPDGKLAFIPFEALISEVAQLTGGYLDYKDLPLLLKEYAISYAYSSTMLFEQQTAKRRSSGNRLLAFAPSYNGADKAAFRGTPRYNYRKDLSSIPGAREEVEQIVQLLRGKYFIDNDATELMFKKTAGDYDILHLAMHAVIDNQNPMYSKLVFTATIDSTEDDLLNTHEIYSLNLKARMIVLSSCSSGEGILQKGEGVISLARGFSYAGCPSLIMTLWEIEDKVSADLMVGFYRYLKKGYHKDRALQKAKVDFLLNHPRLLSHPFYWSAYQCIGDTSPLYRPVNITIMILVITGCSIMLFVLYRWYARRSGNRSQS